MLRFYGGLVGVVGTALLMAPGAQAQETAFVVQVQGGSYSSLLDLNPNGTYKLRTGFNAGAGVGVQVGDHAVFLVEGVYNRSNLEFQGAPHGATYTRAIFTGSVQGQAPLRSGLIPFFRLGGGIMRVDQDGEGPTKTFGAFRGGVGLGYSVNETLTVQVQNMAHLFQMKDVLGVNRGSRALQIDMALGLGVTYTFARRG